MLVCAVIIITPKSPQCNVNNCCEWDIISFSWTFSRKIQFVQKICSEWFCCHWCDRKSRAACAQSFAPWQQATIEIMRRNLSYYCLLAPRIHIFVLHAHLVRGESHNQRNTTGEVATPPFGLTLNAWFVTNGLWAKNCMHMQVVWSEHAMIEWSWVWSLLLPAAILWALFACSGSPIAAVASFWIANWLVSPLLSARNPRCSVFNKTVPCRWHE